MARAKASDTPKYVFPGREDDPTLGGAIPAELFERLQSGEPEPAPVDEPSS